MKHFKQLPSCDYQHTQRLNVCSKRMRVWWPNRGEIHKSTP